MSEERTLVTFKKEDYRQLMAPEVKDATVALDQNPGLMPDDQYRTIIIGVGGTGVKTLDHIKGTLIKKLHPSWKDYIAFLPIDASWSELRDAHYLTTAEGVCFTQNGVAERMSSYATYPSAVRRFMLDGPSEYEPVILGDINSDGASMTRLIGKVKIHDQQPGNIGVDQEIVQKIEKIVSSLNDLPPSDGTGNSTGYEFYVIGSGSGGSGSGGFLEIPALIHKAMGKKPHHINGILYLPDTLTGAVPKSASQLKANGYATLKELNYFQGMCMRQGYEEVWSYGSAAEPELKMVADAKRGFFDLPYLIGSPGLASAKASEVARETIAEFLISMLSRSQAAGGNNAFLTSAFLSNANSVVPMNDKDCSPANPNEEAAGTAHEFPKCFASLGFAEASAPKEVIRAYTVKRTCVNAGLSPVSDSKYDEIEKSVRSGSASGQIIPFRGEEQQDNATVGTGKAKEILASLAKIHGTINNGTFNFIGDLRLAPDAVTWDAIKAGTFDKANIADRIDAIVEERTDASTLTALEKQIDKWYSEYEKEVMAYVKEYGPFAFVNLYKGSFTSVNGDDGMGIGTMLRNLVNGKQLDGKVVKAMPVEAATKGREEARKAINTTKRPLIDLKNVMETQKNAWLDATNNYAKAKINTKRRAAALGENGLLMTKFVRPAAELTDQIEAFGHILCAITEVYTEHGSKMETQEAFADAADTLTEVNIASVSQDSYTALKRQADNSVANVRAREFRDGLVEHFFRNKSAWLEVPGKLVKVSGSGEVKLASPDKPVPARELFDNYATEHIEQKVDVSVEKLLMPEGDKAGADLTEVATDLMKKLLIKSQIRFDGTTHAKYVHKYIKYPSGLNDKAELINAIKTAAATVGVPETSVYPSDDANAIMFYQQATNLEIYRINGLADWEREYEARIGDTQTLMHGKSPDVTRHVEPNGRVTYLEGQTWVDYPSIVCYGFDPTLPNENGEINREGRNRLKVRETIEEARKMGVLYSEKTANGKWVIKRVYCDRKTAQWQDPTIDNLDPDPNTELFPMGKDLAKAMAEINGRTLAEITKVVRLEHGGLFSEPASSEDYAWKYAERVLRAHHPMMREIRYTMDTYFRRWDAQVREWNKEKLAMRRPAMMVQLMKAGILYKKADGAWWWKKADGTEKKVANYTTAMMGFIPAKEKLQINNGLLSYWLFKKVDAAMAGDVLVSECERAKSMIMTWINNDDMIPLQAGAENAAVVENEYQALIAKGARTGDENCTVAFVSAMSAVESSAETLKDIEKFYHRTTLEV